MDVYHLKNDVLVKMMKGPIPEVREDNDLLTRHEHVVNVYKQLRNKTLIRDDDTRRLGWRNISLAANELFEAGWYKKVASVSQMSALQAVKATTNINGFWSLNHLETVQSDEFVYRSTGTYDLVVVDDYRFMVVVGGFLDLSSHDFVSKVPLHGQKRT